VKRPRAAGQVEVTALDAGRTTLTPTARETRFNQLYEEHFDAVRAYAWRRDPDTSDDVVAETFLVAWRRLDEVPSDAAPWLFGVARNVRLNLLRGDRRREALADRLRTAASAQAEPTDERGALAGALASLSERDREVILLTAWEGLDHGEIAAVLGCSRTAARVRLHRARRRLAAALAHPPAASEPLGRPLTDGGPTDA
jgi:RNA polymerase sigma-70 factor, ECF subfamily